MNRIQSNNHIILIGFQYVGKTRIGRALANALNRRFIEVDHELNLFEALQSPPSVITLSGNTLSKQSNQSMIEPHILLHVIAPRGMVFERIMVQGRPAFFAENEDPFASFSCLWNEQERLYNRLTTLTVNNKNTIEDAVNAAIAIIKTCQGHAHALYAD